MAWEWSHTPEGELNIRNNIAKFSKEKLAVIYAEWEAWDIVENSEDEVAFVRDFQTEYDAAYRKADEIPDEILIEYVQERTEAFRTCTNGGHFAYACPYGCNSHLVSFDS